MYKTAVIGDRDSVLGFRALGLDVPEMMRLSQDLRAAGVKGLSGQAMTVEEMAEELCRLKSRI